METRPVGSPGLSGGLGTALPAASSKSANDDLEYYAYHYKVDPCTLRVPHDWAQCPFAHKQGGERSARRDLRRFPYLSIPCEYAKQKRPCPKGDYCPHAHSLYEYWLHPDRFRTEVCQYGLACKRPICFFAHTPEQLRPADPSLPPAELCWQTGASLKFGRNKAGSNGTGSPNGSTGRGCGGGSEHPWGGHRMSDSNNLQHPRSQPQQAQAAPQAFFNNLGPAPACMGNMSGPASVFPTSAGFPAVPNQAPIVFGGPGGGGGGLIDLASLSAVLPGPGLSGPLPSMMQHAAAAAAPSCLSDPSLAQLLAVQNATGAQGLWAALGGAQAAAAAAAWGPGSPPAPAGSPTAVQPAQGQQVAGQQQVVFLVVPQSALEGAIGAMGGMPLAQILLPPGVCIPGAGAGAGACAGAAAPAASCAAAAAAAAARKAPQYAGSDCSGRSSGTNNA